jgi:hypothetical protein
LLEISKISKHSLYKINNKLIPFMPLPMPFTSKLVVFSTAVACRLFLHILGSYFITITNIRIDRSSVIPVHFIPHHRLFQQLMFHRPCEVGLVTVSNHASGRSFIP